MDEITERINITPSTPGITNSSNRDVFGGVGDGSRFTKRI